MALCPPHHLLILISFSRWLQPVHHPVALRPLLPLHNLAAPQLRPRIRHPVVPQLLHRPQDQTAPLLPLRLRLHTAPRLLLRPCHLTAPQLRPRRPSVPQLLPHPRHL